MSPREICQTKIVEFLEKNSSRFDAPYGVLSGIDPIKNGRGKIRTITFGVARYLDASIDIWSEKRIVVKGQGGLAYKVEGNFKSADSLIEHFETEFKL